MITFMKDRVVIITNNLLRSLQDRKLLGISTFSWFIFIISIIPWAWTQIALLKFHQIPLTRGETDGIYYMQFATGPIFHLDAFHGPGYSIAIRIVKFTTGLQLFDAAKFTSLIFGFVFLLSVWLLFSRIHREDQLALLIVMLSLNPVININSDTILSDIMGAALFFATLVFLLFPEKIKPINYFIAGFMGGFAYLTRYVYAVILVIPIISILLEPVDNRNTNRILRLILFFTAFILAIMPWSYYLYSQTGSPFWNQNHLNIAFNMYRNESGWNVFPSAAQFPNLMSVIKSSPQLFVKKWWATFIQIPVEVMQIINGVGYLAALGLFFWVAHWNYRKTILFLSFLSVAAMTALVWFEDRFLLPFIPFYISFIVSGVFELPRTIMIKLPRINTKLSTIHIRWTAIILIMIMSLSQHSHIPTFFEDQAEEYKRAGNWLSTQPNIKESSMLSSKPHIPFYSGAVEISYRSLSLQNHELSDIPSLLQSASPDYFIVDQRYGGVEFPQLIPLLDPENQPFQDILMPVLIIDEPQKLVVYKYIDN